MGSWFYHIFHPVFLSLWFCHIFLSMVPDPPTGRFPFPLILTCVFIAQLPNFCQSAGCRVALCFKVHSSDHQELGSVFIYQKGFPFCKLLICSWGLPVCLFSRVACICLAVSDRSQSGIWVCVSRGVIYWTEMFHFDVGGLTILSHYLLIFDFLYKR